MLHCGPFFLLFYFPELFSKLFKPFFKSSRGGLEVQLWTDNSHPSALVDGIPLGAMYLYGTIWTRFISEAHCVSRSLNALNAIKLIKKFVIKKELLQLITSNFYSTLYYNSDIWNLPSLKVSLKGKLMSASVKALKVCMYYPDPMISFENIHLLNKRATPNAMMKYNLYCIIQGNIHWNGST